MVFEDQILNYQVFSLCPSVASLFRPGCTSRFRRDAQFPQVVLGVSKGCCKSASCCPCGRWLSGELRSTLPGGFTQPTRCERPPPSWDGHVQIFFPAGKASALQTATRADTNQHEGCNGGEDPHCPLPAETRLHENFGVLAISWSGCR